MEDPLLAVHDRRGDVPEFVVGTANSEHREVAPYVVARGEHLTSGYELFSCDGLALEDNGLAFSHTCETGDFICP